MLCNKKGDIKYSTLAKIILILIIAVILIYVTYLAVGTSKRGGDIAACKSWIVFQSAVKDPALGIPLKNLKNPCVTFQDTAEGDKYNIYETLAMGMHDVWRMYGEGKINFFTDRGLGLTSCFIGDEISFDENIKINSINIDDFENYLSHNYPPIAEYTYAEYFLGTEDAEIDFGSGNMDIDSSKRLYIVFIVEKHAPESISGKLEVVGKGIIKTTSLLLIGKLSIAKATTLTRAPVGGINIGGKLYKGGQFLPKGTITKGVNWGTVGLLATGTLAYITSDQSVMVPSIALLEGEDLINESCDYWHYNPDINFFEKTFSGGGGFGGGGAERTL